MYDFGKIRFIQEYEDSTVEHSIRGDASLDEVIEAFERFLKGAGYHLQDGQHIGYEYDEEDHEEDYVDHAMNQWYDEEESEYQKRMDDYLLYGYGDNVVHSKHYWDTERNK